MDKTLFKIIGTIIIVIFSVAIVFLIIFQALINNEKEGKGEMSPMFATPTPIPEVKVIKTPTPIPTPIPTPTPQIPSFGGLFIAELSVELNIPPSDIQVESYKEYVFSNASLECPKPGELYAQVVTPGWIIIFNTNNKNYEIHSNLDGSYYVNCSTISWDETENLVESLNLDNSKKIIISRLTGGVYEELKILNEDEKNDLIKTIDIPLNQNYEEKCIFLYQIQFELENENIGLYAICSDGSPKGIIEDKTGKTYRFPKQFLDLIGKFSSGLLFPGKPSLD
tara:strand:- start:9382 stop:10224 length:843 start_codon:yes stop_codon:yes gene_type:complete